MDLQKTQVDVQVVCKGIHFPPSHRVLMCIFLIVLDHCLDNGGCDVDSRFNILALALN
jgi:hypothetical protein